MSLVRTERLIDDLWSDAGRGVGRNTLQSKVSRLRRALGDPGLLTGDPSGYTLTIDPGSVDALEVLRLAQSAAALRAAGDARPPPVPARRTGDVPRRGAARRGDGAWVAPYRARLEETRLD